MTSMNDLLVAAAQEAVRKTEAEGDTLLWDIDPATYRFWKANAGNSKARRRWRRRDIPNSQRMDAIGVTLADPSEAWEREDL